MDFSKRLWTGVVANLVVLVLSSDGFCADDPLNAFPTADNTAEDRIKKLTEAELAAIKLPTKSDQVILTIGKHDGAKDEQAEPWFRLYADGRVDCGVRSALFPLRAQGQLSEAERTWLLHLAVNECHLLDLSTATIEEACQREDRARDKGPPWFMEYHIHLAGGSNELRIPERALVVRPLRSRLKLANLASLHRYANFLAARTLLGEPDARDAELARVNAKLKVEHPELPPFAMEHLDGVAGGGVIDRLVIFQHEIDLGENKYKRVTATIMQRKDEPEPTTTINVMDFSKYRPDVPVAM